MVSLEKSSSVDSSVSCFRAGRSGWLLHPAESVALSNMYRNMGAGL